MKKFHGILGLIIISLITACGPATPPPDSDPSGTLESAPNETAVPDEEIAAPTITPPPPPESYPAPPLDPAAPEGYPEAPAPPPPAPPSGYPGAYPGTEGQVWIIRPVGEQCAEVDQNSYADLQEAIAALTAAGLTVGEAEMTDLIVCSACGCPTSAHYRVQVAATDVPAAVSLGWEQE
jgi:hypothetical protein